ncbi:MAG: helix-turn-helix transcriptional regulator [Propionivibrio sp.]|nr:helix-turn-helix transcriptional regulator [Chloroflexota bacterium]MBP6422467.1 helix-turn-helix transcriptional regulator [Propionivibrio sp.]
MPGIAKVVCNPEVHRRLGDVETDQFADAFKALSNPIRLQMIDLISQGGGQVCGCDIERHFDLTQPTISHHLKVLRDAGLIQSEPRGTWVMHRLNAPMLTALQGLLMMLNNTGR